MHTQLHIQFVRTLSVSSTDNFRTSMSSLINSRFPELAAWWNTDTSSFGIIQSIVAVVLVTDVCTCITFLKPIELPSLKIIIEMSACVHFSQGFLHLMTQTSRRCIMVHRFLHVHGFSEHDLSSVILYEAIRLIKWECLMHADKVTVLMI